MGGGYAAAGTAGREDRRARDPLSDGRDPDGCRVRDIELTVGPGARVPPAHSHSRNEEIVYVLEGTLRYRVDEEIRDLGPGERMYTPRGSVHAFSNPHDRPARALIILTPDIGVQYFRDVADVAGRPGGPEPAKMAEVMTRYGLVLAPPLRA